MNAAFEGIGASVRRKEDLRFISGTGHYTDDINRPWPDCSGYFRRSDVPHGRSCSVGTEAAQAAPGVVAVYTSADLAASAASRPAGRSTTRTAARWRSRRTRCWRTGFVRHVGDPIAMVVAETRQQAKDAAELLEIEIERPALRRRA